LRLGGFARPILFFFSQRRQAAKKLWSARYDFPPRRTGFAPSLLCAPNIFVNFFFSKSRQASEASCYLPAAAGNIECPTPIEE
jgi:hypothetical protein